MATVKYDKELLQAVKKGVSRSIIRTDSLMTVLIDFDHGPWESPEPPHSHPHEQTAYVAEGEIVFYCEGEEETHLKAGDMYAVPSGKQHTIKLLSKTARLVDSFTPIRQDFL